MSEPIKRALRTFIQAFIGIIISSLATGSYDFTQWRSWIMTLLGAAISGGCAAVMNLEKKE